MNNYTNLFNIASPLDQFEIRNYISIQGPLTILGNISLTNIGLYILLSLTLIISFHVLSNNEEKLIWNKWSILSETIYATVHNITTSQMNKTRGQIYFPFIYTLFIFILTSNLISLVPYSFASTSHFILTFFLSFSIVFGATILGLAKHGAKFFSLFVPSGCPLGLLPLLVIIEFISYVSRNVSLGLRLAANILSGHMLLSILSGFTYKIMTSGIISFVLGLLPFVFITAFSGLEIGIAFIQAQVFVVLTCSYLNDCIELH